MDSLQIRRAGSGDAPSLAALCAGAFRENFEASYTAEDLDAFIGSAYALPKIRAELTDPAYECFLVEGEIGLLGYALLRDGAVEPCVTGPAPIELERIYLLKEATGGGLGQMLLDHCIARALALGRRTLWLGVWEHNPRAQAFYRRNGFHEVGSHRFKVGASEDRDLIVQKLLA